MPYVDLICLANSWKHGGRCVAGIKIDGSGWIRPVGKLADGILHPADYTLDDGTEPACFDLIRVGVAAPRPSRHQPENWVIDGSRWRLLSRPAPAHLAPLLYRAIERGPQLLGSRMPRVLCGMIDPKSARSLTLVSPPSMELFHQQDSTGKLRSRVRFTLGVGSRAGSYNLPITDPLWHGVVIAQPKAQILRNEEGRYVLTISLGEAFEGSHYKLAATIAQMPAGYETFKPKAETS